MLTIITLSLGMNDRKMDPINVLSDTLVPTCVAVFSFVLRVDVHVNESNMRE